MGLYYVDSINLSAVAVKLRCVGSRSYCPTLTKGLDPGFVLALEKGGGRPHITALAMVNEHVVDQYRRG